MESSSIKRNIKPFNGEKYSVWKFRIRALLTEINVIKVIDQEPILRTEAWEKSNRLAKSVLVEYLADSFLGFAKEELTAREILKNLDSLYERKSLANQLALRKKLLSLKLQGDTSLVKHFSVFDDLITELLAAGAKLEETDKVSHLLLTLPSTYDGVITAIETLAEDNLTLAFVKTRLLDHEIKLRNEGSDTVNKILHVETKLRNNAKRYIHPKNNQQNFKAKKKSFVKCHHCGRKGHVKNDCYYFKRHNREETTDRLRTVQAVKLTEGATSSTEANGFAFMAGNFEGDAEDNQITFLLDSGASDHIINREDLFNSYTSLSTPLKISVAKQGEFVTATKRGTLQVISNTGVHGSLEDVLFYREVPYNLLSVTRMQRAGLTITFDQHGTNISKDGNLIMKGVIFDQNTEEIQNAFKFAMIQHSNPNKSRIDFQMFVDIINTADAFKLSRLVCNQFSRGVVALLGAVSPDSFDTLHSYSNTFHLAFVTPWFPEKVLPPTSGLIDYAVSLRPDYHRAIIDTITFYGWKNVIFIYDSHDGLLRLQQLYQSLQPGYGTFRISNVKRVSNASQVIEFLVAIERLDRWCNKYIVLDSATQLAKDVLILHVRDVKLGRRNYHYFLSGLVMDDRWEREVSEFGAINITGFRVVDFSRKVVRDFADAWRRNTISAQAALMYDAVQVLVDATMRLLRKKPDALRSQPHRKTNQTVECNNKANMYPYEHGEKLSRMIKRTDFDGLTGHIKFNEVGHRKNFTLQVMEMTEDGDMVKIATWYDYKGLVTVKPRATTPEMPGTYERNKTYIVSTIEEPPYVMRQDVDDKDAKTIEPFKGFCVDLARMLADKMDIKYEIRLVKDGKYGRENPKMIGGWDGMIGELVRYETDIVVAPLTVSISRESVVDFSKPFLSFDIKPNKTNGKNAATIFSFLHPLSKEIWICIMFSIFAVSVVLFLVSRFSPQEWRIVSFTESQSSENNEIQAPTVKTTIINDFSFWNSIWFSLGSFLQQGSDITPRSISGRIVGSVWWFFTLIVICSYTANLASYLTLTRMSEPIQTFNKLTVCPEDTTEAKHKVPIVKEELNEDYGWFAFITDQGSTSTKKSTAKPCEMLVTITNSGVKDFAVALPKGSALRDGINYALQTLKNDGDLQQLIYKWFTKTECEVSEQTIHGSELTLGQVAGLFYLLVGGLVVALGVALVEFFQSGRREAARAHVPLGEALRARATMASRLERKPPTPPRHQPNEEEEQDRLDWNGAAYAGYYSPGSHNGQEETALHASFTQV